MPRVSKKPSAWAERIGGLLEAGSTVRSWWVGDSSRNDTSWLYVDDNDPDTILCCTIQRVRRPEDLPLKKTGRTPGLGNQKGGEV